jgi:hypothetical protein
MLNTPIFPGCPPLAWYFATKVTGYSAQDCTICLEGRKGVGKSTLTLHLAEETAKHISKIIGGVQEDYFTADNMVSVEKDGALDLLTSGRLKRKNNVFILDDVSVQWNSRNAMSIVNKTLNDILTISRVYRSVIFCNLVARGNSDLILRQMTDYVIRIQSKNTKTGTVIFKCYFVDNRNDGKELLKFLTWRNPADQIKYRIKFWVGNLPSKTLNEEYMKMRQKNTDEYIDQAVQKVEKHRAAKERKPRAATEDPRIEKFRKTVGDMYHSNHSTEEIVRATGLTRYWITKCQMKNEGKSGV